MSKFKTKGFKELHRAWMKKLKDEGFNDIEDLNSPLELLKTWDSTYFIDGPEDFAGTEEYYQVAQELLNSHDFDSELERKIWELHSNGLSVRSIEIRLIETKIYVWEAFADGKKIKESNNKYNKDLINIVIQRLQKFVGRR
jgi:hypothetical protein